MAEPIEDDSGVLGSDGKPMTWEALRLSIRKDLTGGGVRRRQDREEAEAEVLAIAWQDGRYYPALARRVASRMAHVRRTVARRAIGAGERLNGPATLFRGPERGGDGKWHELPLELTESHLGCHLDWMVSPKPGPVELAEAADLKVVLKDRARKAPMLPSTRLAVADLLLDPQAGHSEMTYWRARQVLREILVVLLPHEEWVHWARKVRSRCRTR